MICFEFAGVKDSISTNPVFLLFNASVLGWTGLPASDALYYVGGVTLDRTSRTLNAQVNTPGQGVTQIAGQCNKRATTRQF